MKKTKTISALIDKALEKLSPQELRAELRYLRAAGISRSTWYHHMNALKRVDRYAELKNKISEISPYHKGRYGYCRISLSVSK